DRDLLSDLRDNPDITIAEARLKEKYLQAASIEQGLRQDANSMPRMSGSNSVQEWERLINLTRSLQYKSKVFGEHFQKQLLSTLFMKMHPRQRDRFLDVKQEDSLGALSEFCEMTLNTARREVALRTSAGQFPGRSPNRARLNE